MTPLDFLEHLLVRLPINKRHIDISKIKKHAQAFISLAARGKCRYAFDKNRSDNTIPTPNNLALPGNS